MSDPEDMRLGQRVARFHPPPCPGALTLAGRFVTVVPLVAGAHGPGLRAAYAGADHLWDFLPYGPFPDQVEFDAWLADREADTDPTFFAYLDTAGTPIGMGSFLRIAPGAGSIEVGHLNFSPSMQRSPAATEAMYLMMRWAFEAGYRRYEWKCNALNLGSRRAAQRLGLSYEGVFRQAAVIKGRNRDTAWFAAIDKEWPDLRRAFETWLAPGNFGADGSQKRRLSDLTAPVLALRDPALPPGR